jgi:hypothetical protein
MELVSSNAYSQPFYGILKKLDRKITTSKPRPAVRDSSAKKDESESTPKHRAGNVSPAAPSPSPQTDKSKFLVTRAAEKVLQHNANSPKEQRILSIKEKIDDLTEFFEVKRLQIVTDKVSRFATRLQQAFYTKKKEYFEALEYELRDDFDTRNKKRTYAKRMRLFKQHLPSFLPTVSKAIEASSMKNAFEEIRISAVCRSFAETRRLVKLLHAFKSLAANRSQAVEKRQKERTVSFIMKLDTYLILLKYHAFFCLKL